MFRLFKRTRHCQWYNDVIVRKVYFVEATWLRNEFLKERDSDIMTYYHCYLIERDCATTVPGISPGRGY